VQGIGNICILSTTTQTAFITNCLVTIVHIKPLNSNFSPKIGCHGNCPQTEVYARDQYYCCARSVKISDASHLTRGSQCVRVTRRPTWWPTWFNNCQYSDCLPAGGLARVLFLAATRRTVSRRMQRDARRCTVNRCRKGVGVGAENAVRETAGHAISSIYTKTFTHKHTHTHTHTNLFHHKCHSKHIYIFTTKSSQKILWA